ncbi:hypothetical protein IQ251_00150 [Saccharopolyspora sp. HNM0983]|uniref:Uncharacterized protein n=1 Tax=Saccharopolyspora montiporae TaxID=2781240 RepID=A0A929B7I6_9PSEU|nr:hypothetical protein [Saccharopolyspora sp. HNM0983]MBE9372851.1 hypothetical protein [Saccharopolyspora sp. HNM0983]
MTRGVRKSAARLIGRWRIAEMRHRDRDAIDLVKAGFIEFAAGGTGQVGFIAVQAELDYRPGERDGMPGAEFTWAVSTTAISHVE